MEEELQTLEDSLARFIQVSQRLKAENQELRQELALANNNLRQLKDSMLVASDRLQAIMQKLPEETL